MVKKIDWLETIGISVTIFLLVILCYYHISWKQYLNIPQETWHIIGAIAGNLLYMTMALIIWAISYSSLLNRFFFLINIYFLAKIIYHVTCYAKLNLWPKQTWENIWSVISILCIFYLFLTLISWYRKYK